MAVPLHLGAPDDFEGFLAALRGALQRGLDPGEVRWHDGVADQSSLFEQESEALPAPRSPDKTGELRLPRSFIELLRTAMLHDSPGRFHAAHALAVAILRDRRAWNDTLREERLQLERMAREVRREIHKMHAFVRFRPIVDEAGECHVAWFEPEHHVVRAAAPFFVDRFASMRWAILTPRGSVRWDRRELVFGPAAARAEAPGADEGEALWLAYYRNVFNPARANPNMMRREMPVRFWRNLPEAAQISTLLREADSRTADMESQVSPARERRAGIAARAVGHASSAAAAAGRHACGRPSTGAQGGGPVDAEPADRLAWLARQAAACEQCAFAAEATQTVWGEGAAGAALMFVGEQPGDQEDLAGRPFVGPAGQLLRRAIDRLQWPQDQLYFTNAVKHFKYEWRGKRRLHKTAAQREAQACSQWLEAEIAAVRPRALVALGRTALGSLLGMQVGIEANAGQWITRASDGLPVFVMPHPAAVLRSAGDDLAQREQEWTALLADAGQALTA